MNIRIFDNKGATYDRYTAVFTDRLFNDELHEAIGFNEVPYSPLGFGQHTTAMIGTHLGEEIKFEQLPQAAQEYVKCQL